MMEVIYIGEEFYQESDTHMSSIYQLNPDGTFSRTDWGFVQIALSKGQSVHIRPATKVERNQFEEILKNKRWTRYV